MRTLNQRAADFWETPPRHFWWLVERMNDEAARAKPGPHFSKSERQELLDLLRDAKAEERRRAK